MICCCNNKSVMEIWIKFNFISESYELQSVTILNNRFVTILGYDTFDTVAKSAK